MSFLVLYFFDFQLSQILKFQELEELLEEREIRLENLKVVCQLNDDMTCELSTIKEKYHIISTQKNNKIQTSLEIRHLVSQSFYINSSLNFQLTLRCFACVLLDTNIC